MGMLISISPLDFSKVVHVDRHKVHAEISMILTANADSDYVDVNAYQEKLLPFLTANGMQFEFENTGIGIGKILITLKDGEQLKSIKFICNNDSITSLEANNETVIALQQVIKLYILDEDEKKITEKLVTMGFYDGINSIEELKLHRSKELLKLLHLNQ